MAMEREGGRGTLATATSGLVLAPHVAGVVVIAVALLAAPTWARDVPALVLLLNLVFGGLVAVAVASVTGRAFVARGEVGLLLLSAGALLWGLANALNVVLANVPQQGYDANVSITLFNTAAWLSAICHLAGVATDLRFGSVVRRSRRAWWAGTWVAVALVFAGVVHLARTGAFPPFFVTGEGPTAERQFVLATAAAMFALCAVMLWRASPTRSAFHRWYALSLLLVAEGLVAVLLLEAPGDLLNWTGRLLQYAGGIYMLVAVAGSMQWRDREVSPTREQRARLWPALTVALVLAAAAARYTYLGEIGDRSPYLTFFPAVILAGLYGGVRAGILATLLSAGGVVVFWMHPFGVPWVVETADKVTTAVFVVSGALLSVVCEVLARHQQRMFASERVLDAVREQERFTRHVLDNLFVFVGVMDLDGTLREANRAPLQAAGLAPADVIGRKFWDCYWWSYSPEVQAQLVRAFEEARRGNVVRHDVPVRVSGGALIWIDFQLAPLRDGRGVITHLIPSGTDVSPRRAAEAALRESEQRFRGMVENAALGFAQVALDGTFVMVNRTMCEIVGRPMDELLGRGFAQITHPDDVDSDWAHARLLLSGRIPSYRMEKRYLRPDGGAVWVELSASLVRDTGGLPQYFIAAVINITERKLAQMQLRESEARFRKVFENAPTGIAITDVDGRFLLANPAYQAMLGYDEAALGALAFAQLVHPDDREANLAQIRRLLAGELPFFEIENRYLHRNGEPVWVHKYVTLLRDGQGVPSHIVALVTDIRERVRTEAALREADRRKDEFLATLAHELRNPLAPLRTGLAVLQLAPPGDVERREQVMAAMGRQVGHLTRLVDDLLDLSRITSGKLRLKREPVGMSSVVRAALEACDAELRKRHHVVEVAMADVPLVVDGDAVRLAQVVGNLLGNAAKFTPAGGRIAVSLLREAHEIVLRVRDSGIGIAADKLETVFDMFAQVHPHGWQDEGGLGIGLHLVRRLAEMHGGSARARSDGPGCGSEFEVRLPLATEGAGAAHDGARQVPANSLRVLVVDDNVDAARSMAMLLSLMGHEVVEAYDGAAGLAAATEHRPDVVLLDLGMPRMSGYEVAAAIRAQAWGRGVRIVALSGWGQDEDRARTRAAGFDHHLVKPANPEDIERLLASA